mmetsp:Transcript_55731/g.99239  ORF Transcript_55731/g.99239 Transcript_55731/m.99239 type:complete len:398 (-) Transcript_55731:890-2083(-)
MPVTPPPVVLAAQTAAELTSWNAKVLGQFLQLRGVSHQGNRTTKLTRAKANRGLALPKVAQFSDKQLKVAQGVMSKFHAQGYSDSKEQQDAYNLALARRTLTLAQEAVDTMQDKDDTDDTAGLDTRTARRKRRRGTAPGNDDDDDDEPVSQSPVSRQRRTAPAQSGTSPPPSPIINLAARQQQPTAAAAPATPAVALVPYQYHAQQPPQRTPAAIAHRRAGAAYAHPTVPGAFTWSPADMLMFSEKEWSWDPELVHTWSASNPPTLPGFRSPMQFLEYYQSAWLRASMHHQQPPAALLQAFPYVMRRYLEHHSWYTCAFLLLIVAREAQGTVPMPFTEEWMWDRATRLGKDFYELNHPPSESDGAQARDHSDHTAGGGGSHDGYSSRASSSSSPRLH